MSRLASSALIAFLVLGCKRSDAPASRAVPVASSARDAAAVLAPIVSAAPPPSSVAPAPALPPLDPVATSTVVRHAAIAKTTAATSKREPMRACCDALRKQSQPTSAQAAALCDGVVAAFDESAAAPQLERMIRPLLADAPLPEACKGL